MNGQGFQNITNVMKCSKVVNDVKTPPAIIYTD